MREKSLATLTNKYQLSKFLFDFIDKHVNEKKNANAAIKIDMKDIREIINWDKETRKLDKHHKNRKLSNSGEAGAVLSQMLCLSNDTNSKVGDSKKGGGWMVSRAHSVSYSKSSSDY